jgi:hypothetical protein
MMLTGCGACDRCVAQTECWLHEKRLCAAKRTLVHMLGSDSSEIVGRAGSLLQTLGIATQEVRGRGKMIQADSRRVSLSLETGVFSSFAEVFAPCCISRMVGPGSLL